jgi:hypothetical protein
MGALIICAVWQQGDFPMLGGRRARIDAGSMRARGLFAMTYFVVVPPDEVAPVVPDVPELLLVPEVVPERDGAVVVGEVDPAVPLTEPPAAPIPDAEPEAVPDTGPVLQAAREAAHASAIKILLMSKLLREWTRVEHGRIQEVAGIPLCSFFL